jgi:hypothetical protein
MLVTLSGIVMLVRLVQPENAPSPMLVTLSGITTLVRLVQPENAPSPMLVTRIDQEAGGRGNSPHPQMKLVLVRPG